MRTKLVVLLAVFAVILVSMSSVAATPNEQTDPALAALQGMNVELASRGLNIRASAIDFFNIGQGRPSARILQQEFRWVPNDPNRNAQGDDLTYIVDPTRGSTSSGLSAADTEAAIDRSMNTWDRQQCLRKVDLVKRAYPGSDVTIFDAFFGFGGFGDPFAADIVNAGWYPPEFFAAVGASPTGTLAFSVTFTFIDDNGNPLDSNNDRYIDTALNEVYYNDAFGGALRPQNPWGINVGLPGIDVETVSLHENGHSLGHGHFGPPPSAVMNPIYAGLVHSPAATDNAGMCTLYSSWPRR